MSSIMLIKTPRSLGGTNTTVGPLGLWRWRERKMVFQPDEIKLIRSALDEAIVILPEIERTSAKGEAGLAYSRSGDEGRTRPE